jgi:hypothetical protein
LKTHKIFPLIIISLLIITVFAFFNTANVGASINIFNPAAATREGDQITFLEEALSQEQDPDMKIALENKLNARRFVANTRATAQALPPRSLEEICAGRVQLPQNAFDLPSGILSVRPDFMATQNLIITNMWRGNINGYMVEVYAGAGNQDEKLGLIVLSIESLNVYQIFPDPQPDGALELVADHNLRLELRTSSGAIRYFDLQAREFTDDLFTPLAARDLPPAPTQIPDPCSQFETP